jgi:hypothetical protein
MATRKKTSTSSKKTAKSSSKSGKSAKKAAGKKTAARKPAAKKPKPKAAKAAKPAKNAKPAKSAKPVKSAKTAKPESKKAAQPEVKKVSAGPKPEVATAKPAPATPKPAGAGFSSVDVNMGHVFALRPRIPTAFRPDDFRAARQALAGEAFASADEAARAVALKALELSQDGVIPGRKGHGPRRW